MAAWAARPIDLGPGNAGFRVHVLGPDQIPRVADVEFACLHPELGFLSALAHAEADADPQLVRAALAGLDTLGSATGGVVLLDSLGVGLRGALDNYIMETPEPKSSSVTPEFVQRALLWGRMAVIEVEQRRAHDRGLEEGRHRGLEEGRHAGELHARREILGRLLARAGLHPTAEEQGRITACEDIAALDRWIEQIFGAHDVAQVLA